MGETKQDRYERICNELSDVIIIIEPKTGEGTKFSSLFPRGNIVMGDG
ncbi:MAG: hypothetical protein ABRQ37_19355 [Candidatus Eremiobacterota bacterium]